MIQWSEGEKDKLYFHEKDDFINQQCDLPQPQSPVKILLVQFPNFTWLHVLQFNVFDGQADQSFTGMAHCLDHFPDLVVFALSKADGQPTAGHPFMKLLAIGKQSGRLFNQFHFTGLGNIISVFGNRNGYTVPQLLNN